MSNITESIPQQGFEIVRDAISALLKVELDNQKTLKNLPNENNVYTGRTTPFSHSEKLMINVLCDSANYSIFTEANTQGRTNYFVDVYTSSKQTDGKTGGENSTVLLDSYVGMIRYILQDHRNKTLNLEPPRILGTYVENFENFESKNLQDGAFVKMCRILFSVRINESQGLWQGVDVGEIFTSVKLHETDKGYKYESVN